ncbi:MAG: DUF2092 domain-containing protein [Beijerinckiaceae bacterium]|nr:DUF2092 domain-containing protein [Beijerinckiaceae bacterium]
MRKSVFLASLLALAAFAPPAASQERASAAASAQSVDPAALALLDAMTHTLAHAKAMTFTARAVFDVPTAEGSSIFLTTSSEVAFVRPDKLRVTLAGDGPGFTFVADGSTMARFDPATRTLARRDAPKGLEALSRAAHEHGIDLPFLDVLLEKPFGDLRNGLTAAFVVGQSRLVGGVLTNIVSVTDAAGHAQIWIGATDNLPRQVWVTERNGGQMTRNMITYSNWRLNSPLRDELFTTARYRAARQADLTPAPAHP